MAYAQSQLADWPAAVTSLDDTLRRLGQRLTSAEADLRKARACYEALLEASHIRMRAGPVGALPARLTAQELRVANLVIAGMSNREIADALHVSVHTVKTHVKNVLEKLSIRSRWQMGATIGQLGLGDSPESEFKSLATDIRPASDGAGLQCEAGSGQSSF
jgi:DNA-binding NarL/FixJ family response regulator